jgi:DNA topoisomerase III
LVSNKKTGPSNRSYTVLMVAEKPSIAKAIAEALSSSGGYKESKRAGLPVYGYEGKIFGNQAFFKVTSVAGHVFTRDFPSEYSDW